VHATLAQPAAGADALKDLREQRAQESAENPMRFPEDLGLNFRACMSSKILRIFCMHATLARSAMQDPRCMLLTVKSHLALAPRWPPRRRRRQAAHHACHRVLKFQS
jgi:hypothetical protein